MLNIPELTETLLSGKDIDIEYKFVSEEDHQQLYNLLLNILGKIDRLFLTEVISTILKEILMNANKANAKRIYFLKKDLDIHNPDHYSKGMKTFQQEITHHWDEQKEILQNSGFQIHFRAKMVNNNFAILVENDSALLPQELDRIKKRIESAKKYNDLSDAFMDISDSQESAGLGLVLIQLLLKNSGIGSDKFKIDTDGKLTRATLVVPQQIVPIEITTKLKEKILIEIEGLPPLPNTLTRIISLCNNPDSDLGIIANEIEKNPALSVDLLKLSNSAGFASRNKVNTIVQAVKVVGLKNVRNLLYVSGVRKIMDGRYAKLQEVWNHSNMCSFFIRQIAGRGGMSRVADIAAAGALLHDLGKFILLSLNQKLFIKLTNYQKDRDFGSSTILEEISIGISHPTLGALLAKKWDFPPDLVQMIEFHHRPFMNVDSVYHDLVELVYLANMMMDYIDKKASFFTIDETILRKYDFADKKTFEETCEKLRKLYEIAKMEN
ncbi:HDIG domain protein [Leptospira weilii str. 2006001853]|uniref:HDIG domain protein n=4 Tax=Leptospira weilii TaxID=28184 RepID=A0A828YY83_9LEPT|nr:HDOD domain-containing protein [Leptospira weilii]EMM70628.1 HDIG domain protein [Leptospira weilii str. 2006001855]EKR63835.1 HDIG domain protein [Leptospira weilii str. 2006001853]EMN43197.1 HDIG domain protein [Leptospira weilii str. LNT 1234]EMN89866.1 HDIG domain protein [Leptospira weilii str. UI 13098]MCL8265467.1 HDOD domain-containing protein [Leptospira weilii]